MRQFADAVIGYAERLARREDRPYVKTMSAMFAIAAFVCAYYDKDVAVVSFALMSFAFAALLVPIRRTSSGGEPSDG